MKLSTVLFLTAASKASGFSVLPVGSASRTQLEAAKVFYDTSTGNTETCAEYIAKAAGVEAESIGTSSLLFQIRLSYIPFSLFVYS